MRKFYIDEILTRAVGNRCSDIHLTVGRPPMNRIDGSMVPVADDYDMLTSEDTIDLAKQLADNEKFDTLEKVGECDFAHTVENVSRFRVNIFKQKGNTTIVLRALANKVPSIDDMHLPDVFKTLAMKPRGLILVTGPTGSGKSTSLAAMLDYINDSRKGHIITLEEPIEYVHNHKECIIHQREIGTDTGSFSSALRAALREDPDVILVGEMRDFETVSIALSAAETGHLVLSTLHTVNATQTVDRIIDMFPSEQQQQIRVQLAGVLEGVISQQLLKKMSGRGRVAAMEILVFTDAIRNIIREGKTHQIPSNMQTGLQYGMVPMDYSLGQLVKQGKISRDEAEKHTSDLEMLKRYMM